MNKTYEINYFLNYFSQIYQQNPNLEITSDTFYYALANYGLNNEQIENGNIKNYFSQWINHFKNSKNIKVFYHPNQTRFLQFNSSKDTLCVKIYVSFNKEDIYECVNKIFEYIDKNFMPTYSKVSDTIRSDSVIIRLNSINDAKQVINFINNNEYLKIRLQQTNPFLTKDGNIGLAYDKNLSYNETLASILSHYFIYLRRTNNLQNANINSLTTYIEEIYNQYFINDQICQSKELLNYYKDRNCQCDLSDLITNFDQIISLIYISLYPQFNSKNYFDFVEQNFYNKALVQNIKNEYQKKLRILQKINNDNIIKPNTKKILDQYILTAQKKYGTDNIIKYLLSYIYGNHNAITRDYNFRQLFINYIPPNEILKITNNNPQEYIYYICNNYKYDKINEKNLQ